MIVRAKRSDHEAVVKLARLSPYTRDFSNHMFSGEAAYEKGWVRIAVVNGKLVGFTCVRHKVQQPETSLYFIGIHPDEKGKGYGTMLMRDLERFCRHKRIVLNVMKDNHEAVAFYERLGFHSEGEALKGKGIKLAKEWK